MDEWICVDDYNMFTRLNHAASYILKVRGLASVQAKNLQLFLTLYRYIDLHFLIVLDSETTVPCTHHPTKLRPLLNVSVKMQLINYSDWESNILIAFHYLTLFNFLNVFNLYLLNIFTEYF